MALMDPLTRVALDDLEARDFTTPERQEVFEAIRQNRNEVASVDRSGFDTTG